MEKFKKYTKYGLLIFSIVILMAFLGLYIYFSKFACFKINKDDRDAIISSVKAAPPLPLRFYDIYNKVYPKALNYGQLYYLFNRENNECPCRLASYDFSSAYNIHLTTFVFWLESQVSQKDCLTFYLQNVYLSDNTKGIYQYSLYYFDNELDSLSDYELLELIFIIENPSFYNKKRNTDKLSKKVNDILNRVNL